MTRVIAGTLRGRRVHTPKGAGTRPTSDRTREALFSALEARGAVHDSRVLDLYAGSGALGVEAMSRGARAATLVDHDRGAVAAMRRTLADLGLASVRIQQRDVRAYLRGRGAEHDLVFIDPPYDASEETMAEVLDLLTSGWLADAAIVVVERSARSPEPTWPRGLEPFQERTYGETAIWLAASVQDGTVDQ